MVDETPADRDLAPLRALVEQWRAKAEQHLRLGGCYLKGQGWGLKDLRGQGWGLKDCADELEHALAELTREDGGGHPRQDPAPTTTTPKETP